MSSWSSSRAAAAHQSPAMARRRAAAGAARSAGGPAAAAGQVRDGGRDQACGAGDAAVGAAVLAQLVDAGLGRAPVRGEVGGRVRRVSWGWIWAGGGVDAHPS